MLEIKGLCVSVAGTEILKGLDLSVNAGEVHAIMGRTARARALCLTSSQVATAMTSPPAA